MAILYGHTQHEQDVPDMAYEAHSFGSHVQGTQVYVMPSSENPHTFEASGFPDTDEATSRRLYEGMRVPRVDMEPQARGWVKAKFPTIDKEPRVSDEGKRNGFGRLECTHEGCDWWCGSHNEHKMTARVSKKHGGA